MHEQRPDEPDEVRYEQAFRPCQWSLTDRLSADDVQAIISLYQAGTIAKDLATTFP